MVKKQLEAALKSTALTTALETSLIRPLELETMPQMRFCKHQ